MQADILFRRIEQLCQVSLGKPNCAVDGPQIDLGLPILGDKIYGLDEQCYLDFIDAGWTPDLARRIYFSRQALHSHRLEVAAEQFSGAWECDLPAEMQAWL